MPRWCRAAAARLCLALSWLVGLATVAACGRSGPEPDSRWSQPVFPAGAVPEVLIESPVLETPPAYGPNRFVSGWWPAREEGARQLVPARAVRLELANLDASGRAGRALVLDFEGAVPSAEHELDVTVAGEWVGRRRFADPLVIPLTGVLPLGRFAIDLDFGSDEFAGALRVAGSRQLAPLPAGEATPSADGSVWTLRGDVAVEWVTKVPAGASLTGTVARGERNAVPPAFRFSVIDAAGGEDCSVTAEGPFECVLSAREPSLRLLRWHSRGEDSVSVWRDLAWRGAPPPRADPAEAVTTHPWRTHGRPRVVLLLVLDALRADFVGFHGGPGGVSPVIDRLAAEGAVFTTHHSVAPNTLPSTKALFLGATPRRDGGAVLSATGGTTLAEAFAAAGYRTGSFSANPNVGPAFGMTRGFEHVASELFEAAGGEEARRNESARRVYGAARAWLDGLGEGERAFAYLHTLHPHNPYAPPPDLAARFAGGIPSRIDGSTRTLLDLAQRRRLGSAADIARLRGLYAASVAYNDRELGAFLAAVRADLGDDLLVVVTSDHGEEIGDRGGFLHGYTLYEEMLRIPLVLWSPRRIVPGRFDGRTDTLDLHATLLALLGARATSDGEPLFDDAIRSGAPRGPSFAAGSSLRGGLFAARDDRWKVIFAPRSGTQWGMGNGRGRVRDAEFVFDLAADPGERRNLAGATALPFAARALRQDLWRWMRGGAGEAGVEPEVDAETRARLRALGYVE